MQHTGTLPPHTLTRTASPTTLPTTTTLPTLPTTTTTPTTTPTITTTPPSITTTTATTTPSINTNSATTPTVAHSPGADPLHSYNYSYIAPGASIPTIPLPSQNIQAFVNAQNDNPDILLPSAPALEKMTDYVDEIYQITSTSTAHDVWRIFDRKRSCFNRSIWAILWLTCFSLYLTYFIAQLLAYLTKPTSTLIESVLQTPQQFPSVALCLTSTNTTLIRQFYNIPNANDSIGIRCAYGFSITAPVSGFTQTDCRPSARKEWADYPFGVAPTACLRFNPLGQLMAELPGTSMTFIVNVPGLTASLAPANFQLLEPDEPVYPLLSNLIDISSATKVLFSKSVQTILDACSDANGGQRACVARSEQACIERVCNCTYPDPNSPEDLPGSCIVKLMRGECVYNKPIYPCVTSKDLCRLEEICSTANVYGKCPYPSCSTTAYFADVSTNQLPPQFQGSGIFAMSVVLRNLNVETLTEVQGMTLLDFFGSIGGMMGLLLGFSVLTLFEWFEGCCRIGSDVSHDVDDLVDNDMVDAEAHANIKPVKQA